MKPYDATKYMRQLKWKPNRVPFCAVLLALLLCFMANVPPTCIRGANVYLPEAYNTVDEPMEGLVTLLISDDGKLWLDNKRFEADLSLLPGRILENFEEKECDEEKVLIKAESEVPFGRLQQVLKAVKEAKLDTVGLIVDKVFR